MSTVTEVNGGGVFQREEQRMSLTCPYSSGKSGFGNGLRGHRRVTYQAVRTFNLSSGLGLFHNRKTCMLSERRGQ